MISKHLIKVNLSLRNYLALIRKNSFKIETPKPYTIQLCNTGLIYENFYKRLIIKRNREIRISHKHKIFRMYDIMT